MEFFLFRTGDQTLRDLYAFRTDGDREAYYRAARALISFAARRARCGDVLREYVVCALLDAPGAGDLIAAPELSKPYLLQDVDRIFADFFAFDWEAHCRKCGVLPFPDRPGRERAQECPWEPLVQASSAPELEEAIRAFFRRYHDRSEARYTAFRWEGGELRGVRNAERMTFGQLAGLRHQKEALLRNARAFLAGLPAHNVLLVGGSGTGKSSCVKATLTEFAAQGLRLVELPKQCAGELPLLMEVLAPKKCRYIVYIDDLSFEEVDVGYKELKVALDGQVEQRLGHVLIYVTSNRRHLIRETWKDRDTEGEIHENDTLHEKKSLSERFGLHLYFSVLSQKEYFAVVELLLSLSGFAFTGETAKAAAAWALSYNGRSGRTARQFVNDYIVRHSGEQPAED